MEQLAQVVPVHANGAGGAGEVAAVRANQSLHK
jgi:hypothetical protein